MKIKSQKDFFAGLMYLVVGGAFAIGAYGYNVGTAARMGPGYFPMILGILLVGVPALGIPGFGLIVAIYALVLIASYARKEVNFKESLVLATVLAIGSYAVFVWALNLQFPVWPSFIVG